MKSITPGLHAILFPHCIITIVKDSCSLTFTFNTCMHICMSMAKGIMTIRYLLFFIMCLASQMGMAQKVLVNVYLDPKVAKSTSDTIYYDVNRPLSWKDFQGTPDAHSNGGAVTGSGFAFDADVKMDRQVIYLNIGVYVFFSKKGSWRKKDIGSDYHLLHEQHHFDISRIASEKFISLVAKAKFTKDNYNKLLSTLFDQAYSESNRLQAQYDRETEHSINKQEQLRWNEIISSMVSKL